MQSLEIYHRVYLYTPRNLSGFESEPTMSTLKVCDSQEEKVSLRTQEEAKPRCARGADLRVNVRPRLVRAAQRRAEGTSTCGHHGRLLRSESFHRERGEAAAHGSERSRPLRGQMEPGSATGNTGAERVRAGVRGRLHVCTACVGGAAASSAALDKTELCKAG